MKNIVLKTFMSSLRMIFVDKIIFNKSFLILPALMIVFQSFSQTVIDNGELNKFIKHCSQKKSDTKPQIFLGKDELKSIQINVRNKNEDVLEIIGSLEGHKSSTIFFKGNKNGITGKIILPIEKRAFNIYSDNGKMMLLEENINKYICTTPASQTAEDRVMRSNRLPKAPQIDETLESYPNSNGTIYLDFDGHLVTGTAWNGGATIDCVPSGFSANHALASYLTMAEDFRPFNVNVTTNEQVFFDTPINRRVRVIFTSTETAAPGAGGVALLTSFSWGQDTPCFVFNPGVVTAAETGSHEAGHTLGLNHDGDNLGNYFRGHGNWGALMGSTFRTTVNQWSQGEYASATNQEDDMAIMSSGTYGLGYKDDQHDDDYNFATSINFVGAGVIESESNHGIIEHRGDLDNFKFQSTGGLISISANPDPYFPNLDIQLRLLDVNGNEVAKNDSPGLSASLNVTTGAGIFYLEVDGVGAGDPVSDGYSDYGSIGYFELSGTYPASSDPFPPVARFRAEKEAICTGESIQFTDLSGGSPEIRNWTFEGGTPASSTDINPSITYSSPGIYRVTLEVNNSEGTDTKTIEELIHVGQTSTIPLVEGFENNFPPLLWKIINPDGGLRFEQSTITGATSANCMIMNNADNSTVGELDEIWMTPLNLEYAEATKMTFDLAYTMFDLNSPDELRVFVATECAPTAQDWTEVFFQNHVQLQTKEIPTPNSNAWVPTLAADWKTEEISLADYEGSPYVLVKFQNKSGFGTRIWIDNVNFNGILGKEEIKNKLFTIYPNPTQSLLTIDPSAISDEIKSIDIYNSVGQQVSTHLGTTQTISVEHLSKGIYTLQLIGKNQTYIQKFVKN